MPRATLRSRASGDFSREFKGYGRHCWGITASEGPGPDTIKVNGIERQFRGADHLRLVLEEAQTIVDDALREVAEKIPSGGRSTLSAAKVRTVP